MAEINKSKVVVKNRRITKLREYLLKIIDELLTDTDYQINADMLINHFNNYSLDKIPTASTVENWIIGYSICKDVFSFRSRNRYNQDIENNLLNIGFFEVLEQKIKSNNEEGILPDIDGIEEIKCLNCGTMIIAEPNTAEFEIQIQIEYRK